MSRSAYEDLLAMQNAMLLTSDMGLADKLMINRAVSPTDTVWPSANRAYFVKLWNPAEFWAERMWCLTGATGAGNIDMGIYALNGTTLTLLRSTGSASQTAGNLADTNPLTSSLLVPEGEIVLAVAMDTGTDTFLRETIADFSLYYDHLCRYAYMDSAFPLPATATPLAPTGLTTGPPIFGVYNESWQDF